MCKGYQDAFPWVKRPERGFDHPPPSGTGFKERVELWRIYCPFLLSWHLRDRIAPLTSKIFLITCNYLFKSTEQCSVQIWTRSADQCMSHRLWYRTFHHQVRRNPPLEPILNHTRQILTTWFTSSSSLQYFGTKLWRCSLCRPVILHDPPTYLSSSTQYTCKSLESVAACPGIALTSLLMMDRCNCLLAAATAAAAILRYCSVFVKTEHARARVRTPAHTHTHVCTPANTRIPAHIHTHAHARTHAHTRKRTRTPVHTHAHTPVHVRAHTHARPYTRTHARTHAHTHARPYTRTHTHTHTRTHSHASEVSSKEVVPWSEQSVVLTF